MDIKQRLKALLPNAKYAAGNKELTVRCPYCGHTSSPYKQHMYICVDGIKPYMYNCFKCNNKGLVNYEFFRDLGVYDADLIQEINLFNRSCKEDNSFVYRNKDVRDNYINYMNISIPNNYKSKLDYLNSRIGTSLSVEEFMQQKIVFNFYMFKPHIIRALNCSDYQFNIIQRNYVGFLSVNNTTLILRNTMNDNNLRYIIVPLGDFSNMRKIYSIPQLVNPMERITAHIAEGQFDILSIYNNLCNRANGIYMASSGNKFYSCIEYILFKGALNVDYNIYIDNDSAGYISEASIKKFIFSNIHFFRECTFTIHKNVFKGMKDYGVPLDNITDSSYQL